MLQIHVFELKSILRFDSNSCLRSDSRCAWYHFILFWVQIHVGFVDIFVFEVKLILCLSSNVCYVRVQINKFVLCLRLNSCCIWGQLHVVLSSKTYCGCFQIYFVFENKIMVYGYVYVWLGNPGHIMRITSSLCAGWQIYKLASTCEMAFTRK